MPNHVRNILKMKGIASLPLFGEDDGGAYFDFNKIIPMPKSLEVESGSRTDQAIVYYLTEMCKIPIDCVAGSDRRILNATVNNSVYKGRNWAQEVFECVLKGYADATEEDKQELYEKGKIYVQNFLSYGCTTWYEWCIRNWGTKWNAYGLCIEGNDIISFSTAWNAPEPVIDKLAEMYPNKIIQHWWADEDTGSNAGYKEYSKGTVFGGYYPDGSNAAFETYIKCWGEDEYLAQDKEGNWYVKD